MNTEDLALTLRKHVVRMTGASGASHVGSCLSLIDIMAVLFGEVANLDPKNPKWEKRDRVYLSKGHAAAAFYASIAEKGFIQTEELTEYYSNGSRLMGHISHKVPGAEFSTGSLGHGMPVATGAALAGKMNDQKHRVFAMLSDGECDEGSIWEAAMFAGHHKLDNLVVIVDYNKIQSLKSTHETLNLEPFADKWRSFGWDVADIDGHDHNVLKEIFAKIPFTQGKPNVILANTTKGKGISFMENSVLWHYRSPKGEEFEAAMKELEAAGA